VLYFDHNATSPLSAVARKAWLDAHDEYFGNPSSPHRLGARADSAISAARAKVAALLGCDPHGIVWTSGATEANNTTVRHFSLAHQGEAWVSAIEHPSLLGPVRYYFPQRHRLIPVIPSGVVDLQWIASNLASTRPAFIAVMAANNETGVLQPWREIGQLCRQADVPFFCDAVQWIGKLDSGALAASCDFVSCAAHKFGGPQGVGFLKCPGSIDPLLRGGPQEESRRAGTENVASIIATAAAIEVRAAALREGKECKYLETRDSFIQQLRNILPTTRILGGDVPRLWNTVTAVMPRLRGDARWVVKLDKLGFAVSTGSACASGREEPSHVTKAMGLGKAEASLVLRFSGGWETRAADWEELRDGIQRVAEDVGLA
jgi:cysteine desulfurase